MTEGHPDHCSLCRKRAGLPTPEIVIEYEKPVIRLKGEACHCRHCTALRAEGAAVESIAAQIEAYIRRRASEKLDSINPYRPNSEFAEKASAEGDVLIEIANEIADGSWKSSD